LNKAQRENRLSIRDGVIRNFGRVELAGVMPRHCRTFKNVQEDQESRGGLSSQEVNHVSERLLIRKEHPKKKFQRERELLVLRVTGRVEA